jgi:hypothetical protein
MHLHTIYKVDTYFTTDYTFPDSKQKQLTAVKQSAILGLEPHYA